MPGVKNQPQNLNNFLIGFSHLFFLTCAGFRKELNELHLERMQTWLLAVCSSGAALPTVFQCSDKIINVFNSSGRQKRLQFFEDLC